MSNIRTEALAHAQAQLSRLEKYKNSTPNGELSKEDHKKDKRQIEAKNIVQPILEYLKTETQSLSEEGWSVTFSSVYPKIIKLDLLSTEDEFLHSESSKDEMNEFISKNIEIFSNVTAASCTIVGGGDVGSETLTISLLPVIKKERQYFGHAFLLRIEKTNTRGKEIIADHTERVYASEGVQRMREEIIKFVAEFEYFKLFMSAYPPM